MTAVRTFVLACTFLVACMSASSAHSESYYVEGDGGVPLAVTVTGPEDGPEILFIHGIGMGAESFKPQLDSELADRYRMVAFDLRGHGMSGKPWNEKAYTDPAVWAEDVAAVIRATGLKKPILVGWSYGTLVAADYLREKGTDGISGLVMVGALGGFVPYVPPSIPPDPKIMAQLTRAGELRQIPVFDAQQEAVDIISPMVVGSSASREWIDHAKTLGMMVPPYAQPLLRKHPMDNHDLVPLLRELPIYVMYGELDPSVPATMLSTLMEQLPNAMSRKFDKAGHSPFAEQPDAFSHDLACFVNVNWKKPEK